MMLRRRKFLLIAAAGGVGALCPAMSLLAEAANIPILVHRDPTCACCSKWIQHLERNGFSVDDRRTKSFGAIRDAYHVPRDLEGCHVAEVQGMIVEGHVPAEEIKVALQRRAAGEDVIGVSVPGMPVGSPGMGSGSPELYEVILFGKSGRTTLSRWLGSRRQ